MWNLLSYELLGNTVARYALFAAALIAGFVIVRLLGRLVVRRLDALATSTKAPANTLIVGGIRRHLLPAAYLTVVYLSAQILSPSPWIDKILSVGALGFGIVMSAWFVSSLAVIVIKKYWGNKQEGAHNTLAVRLVSALIKAFVWIVAAILFLDNIGIKIGSLLAGVGIGGVAVAFAAQAILADVFSFFTIFFDRPFEIGDFIVVGESMGVVEHIGVKTTRLRALSGEQLVFSNADLTSSRINNYQKLERRRVLFTVSVGYDTPSGTLREIPGLFKSIIEGIDDTSFSRAHFVSCGEAGFNFEAAYFILNNDFNRYMDIHQEVNFGICAAFEARGIRYGIPARSVLLPSPPS